MNENYTIVPRFEQDNYSLMINFTTRGNVTIGLRIKIPEEYEKGAENKITSKGVSEDELVKDFDSMRVEYVKSEDEQSLKLGMDEVLSYWRLVSVVIIILVGLAIRFLKRSAEKKRLNRIKQIYD